MPSSVLDLNSENIAPNNWRLDSWGVPPVTDNYGVVMDTAFDPNAVPMVDSDDSTADQEELSSGAPSSPSSVETPVYHYDQIENDPLSAEEWYENGPLGAEELSEEMSEDTTAEPLSEPSSVSYSTPESNMAFTAPSSTHAPVAPSTPAAAAKRRGRPRTKVSPISATAVAQATTNAGGRKRRSESAVPESLLGTKKSKGASAIPNILDRLPSSISPTELQSMSSADFDSYYAAVASKLPKSEIEIAKAQRRRIKNRESASNSRVRKQDNLSDLEAQVQQLREQNETLRQKSLAIQSEHRAMARELDTYKRLVREHLPPQFVPSFFSASSSGAAPASNSTDVIHVTTRNGRSSRILSRDVSSAALMCIILFAVIWGSSTVFPSSVLRDANVPLGHGPAQISFPLPDAPHLAPVASSATALTSTPPSVGPTSRRNQAALAASAAALAQKQAQQAAPSDAAWLARVIREREEANIKRATVAASSVKVEELDDETVVSGSASPVVINTPAAAAANNAMLVSTDELKVSNDTMLNAHLGGTPLATSSSSAFTATTGTASSETASVVDTTSPQWKQNTTYIKCDSMQQVVPPTGAQPPLDPNAPLFVSLWVNPSVIGDSSISSASKDPFNMDCLVQITCQIVNVEQLGIGIEQVAIASGGSNLPSAPGLSMPAALATSSS